MQSLPTVEIAHEVECAGVDWITATAQTASTRADMMEFARHQQHRLMDAGQTITPAYRLGYTGFQADQFFFGSREGSSMIVASGATAHSLFRSIRNVSDNISRLDLQVTVSLPRERLHIARNIWSRLQQHPPCKVPVRNFMLIQSDPQGETLNVNKRSSDAYARVYDKAAESGEGAPLSRWRFEVEYKRSLAKTTAARISHPEPVQVAARGLVWEWFDARGVTPIFERGNASETRCPVPGQPKRDVLKWFDDTVSITVARAVKRHGLLQVLESLHLLTQIFPDEKERSEYATRVRRNI